MDSPWQAFELRDLVEQQQGSRRPYLEFLRVPSLSLGIYSLDPATGKPYWEVPYETKMAHSVATPVFDEASGLLFVSSFFG